LGAAENTAFCEYPVIRLFRRRFFLFMATKKLTNEDFCRAAKRLKCGVANIKTVDDVESKGSGFYSDGFPTILFECHKFHKYSKGKFSKDYPEISNPNAGGYGKAGANQRRKFNLAFSLDPKAAMLSCSWGRYQIMGFNYAVCGFVSVGDFVDAMKESEGAQLLAFCEFVEENNLADELRNREWADFARGYNGKNYKINEYDTKLAAAYKQFSKENIDCSKVSTDTPKPAEISSSPKEIPAESTINSVDAAPVAAETPAVEAAPPQPPPVEVEQVKPETEPAKAVTGIQASLAGAITFITTTFGGIVSLIAGVKTEIIYGFFGASAVIGTVFIINRFWYSNKEKQREHEERMERGRRAFELQKLTLESAMRPDLNTVILKPTSVQNSEVENNV
jgi:hypothetical protein